MAFGRARAVGILAFLFLIVGGITPSVASAQPQLAVSAVGSLTVDGSVAAQTLTPSPGVINSIDRLYLAVMNRWPDEDGRAYWYNEYISGRSLASIAEWFMTSPEWTALYGAVDDEAFVHLLYNNVLDRDPDPGGGAYWAGRLATGTTRTSLLLGFSESDEFVSETGTASPEAPPSPFPALPAGSGEGRRIVYSNSLHRVWMVEANGQVVDSYLVSGRRATPGPGTYTVYSKSPLAWAGHDGITMTHMVRFAHGATLAIGFHGIPRYANGAPMQTEAQLGSWRSSGCVRQNNGKAEALYHWAPVGTVVVVLA